MAVPLRARDSTLVRRPSHADMSGLSADLILHAAGRCLQEPYWTHRRHHVRVWKLSYPEFVRAYRSEQRHDTVSPPPPRSPAPHSQSAKAIRLLSVASYRSLNADWRRRAARRLRHDSGRGKSQNGGAVRLCFCSVAASLPRHPGTSVPGSPVVEWWACVRLGEPWAEAHGCCD